jgi:hypothetical protein
MTRLFFTGLAGLCAFLAIANISMASAAVAADYAIVPDPTLTPGVVRTTDPVEICEHGTRELRHWSREADDRILLEYGLPPSPGVDRIALTGTFALRLSEPRDSKGTGAGH